MSDIKTYKYIIRKVIFTHACFDVPCPHKPHLSNDLPCLRPQDSYKLRQIPYARKYYLLCQKWNWWIQLLKKLYTRRPFKK